MLPFRDAENGDPGGTRTPYLQIRNLSLYPDELRDHSRTIRKKETKHMFKCTTALTTCGGLVSSTKSCIRCVLKHLQTEARSFIFRSNQLRRQVDFRHKLTAPLFPNTHIGSQFNEIRRQNIKLKCSITVRLID